MSGPTTLGSAPLLPSLISLILVLAVLLQHLELTAAAADCSRYRLHEQSRLGNRVKLNRRLPQFNAVAVACDDDAAGVPLLPLSFFRSFLLDLLSQRLIQHFTSSI